MQIYEVRTNNMGDMQNVHEKVYCEVVVSVLEGHSGQTSDQDYFYGTVWWQRSPDVSQSSQLTIYDGHSRTMGHRSKK